MSINPWVEYKDRPVKVLIEGTLGDAFLAYCRFQELYDLYGVTFEATRISRPEYVYFDEPISELCTPIPIIDYKGSTTDRIVWYENADSYALDGKRALQSEGYDLVSINTRNIQEIFSMYRSPKCFPSEEDMGLVKNPPAKKNVVIQVQGGKYRQLHGHMRGFSKECLAMMCEYLNACGYHVNLIGVPHPLFTKGLDNLTKDNDVTNLIGKTSLTEAMVFIVGANYFIGFDGFFTFFAPSQKIPTIHLSHLRYNPRIDFECPCWKEWSILVRPIPASVPINFSPEFFDVLFNDLIGIGENNAHNYKIYWL